MDDDRELRDLAAGLRARRNDAWERLYDLTHLPLLRLLRRLTGDDGKAEEALQAAYVTAVERIAAYDPRRGTPDAWLAGIARRKAIDIGRARRGAAVDVDTIDVAGPQAREGGADGGIDGELIASALDRLEPRHAEVLRRKYIEGESLEAIAGGLGLKPATVGTLLHRARDRFREAYGRLLARGRRKAQEAEA
jgi:RNA polymerase sigma-70 factor (ECF subfamily)